jgi:hypothetical protein
MLVYGVDEPLDVAVSLSISSDGVDIYFDGTIPVQPRGIYVPIVLYKMLHLPLA